MNVNLLLQRRHFDFHPHLIRLFDILALLDKIELSRPSHVFLQLNAKVFKLGLFFFFLLLLLPLLARFLLGQGRLLGIGPDPIADFN